MNKNGRTTKAQGKYTAYILVLLYNLLRIENPKSEMKRNF